KEGQVAPLFPPVANQCALQCLMGFGTARVAFTLIPHKSLDSKGHDWRKHAVIARCGLVLYVDAVDISLPGKRTADLIVPVARKIDGVAGNCQVVRLGGYKSTLASIVCAALDDVPGQLQDAPRYMITPLWIFIRLVTDLPAIIVNLIGLHNASEGEADSLVCHGRRHVDLPSVPYDAIKILDTLILPIARYADGLPALGFEGRIVPGQRTFHALIRWAVRVERAALLRCIAVDTVDARGVFVGRNRADHIRKGLQPFFAGPRLDRSSANAGVDDTDGNAVFFMELFSKKVSDDRKAQNIVPRSGDPFTGGEVICRPFEYRPGRDRELSYLGEVRSSDFGSIAVLVQFQVMYHV